jgi:hypothetical protein
MRLAHSVAAAPFVVFVVLMARVARAETLQAPVGGKSITIPDGRVACGTATGGWTIDAGAKSLKPPATDDTIGKDVELVVAPRDSDCAASTAKVTLVATGKWPTIDTATTVLAVDDALVDVHGRGLKGIIVRWESGGHSGEDRCVAPQADANGEKCSVGVGRGLAADPTTEALSWRPAGSRGGADVVTFDANGRRASGGDFLLRVGKVVVNTLVAGDSSVDLAGGAASRVILSHPEAVTFADCGAANCEISGGAVLVHSVTSAASTLPIALRLVPRVFVRKGEALDSSPVVNVPVLPCAMSIASGDAPRGVDDTRVVVRIDARCASEARALRYYGGGRAADVLAVESDQGAAYVLLRVGRIEGDELPISATRGGADVAAVGAARVRTRAIPAPRAVLELGNAGTIDFIPTNREATVHFASPEGARLVLLPVDGVYDVSVDGTGATRVRGERSAAGFVALRFGLRVPTLPGSLSSRNLAVLTDPVERTIREANLPEAIGASALTKNPLVELVCGTGKTQHTLAPGGPSHIAYDDRDACRLVFHRERIASDAGAQKLTVDIDITRVDGTPRPEARVSQALLLREGREPLYLWIKGILGPFDRVTVRLSHVDDETHYVDGGNIGTATPAVQWAIVAGTSKARIYATTAIPTGLFRVSDRDHSGILTLNLGLLARFTWLDSDGHEGIVGLEGGMMAVGLANDVSLPPASKSLTEVATVCGIGFSVPIANRSLATETSINLHAWFEYEVSRAVAGPTVVSGSPFGFVFGPSISIGNIGANL